MKRPPPRRQRRFDHRHAVEEVNERFYRAFQSGSLRDMAAVWGKGEHVQCVHPGAGCIAGRDAVSQRAPSRHGCHHCWPAQQCRGVAGGRRRGRACSGKGRRSVLAWQRGLTPAVDQASRPGAAMPTPRLPQRSAASAAQLPPPPQVLESWKAILGTGRYRIRLEDIRVAATERWAAGRGRGRRRGPWMSGLWCAH